MAKSLEEAEAEARSIVQEWMTASAEAAVSGGAADLFETDQTMSNRIVEAFGAVPAPALSLAAAWALAAARAGVDAMFALNPIAQSMAPDARLRALARTTRSAGEATIAQGMMFSRLR